MIRTLKDLKDALNKLPDDRLEFFGVGINFEGEDEYPVLLAMDANNDYFYEVYTEMFNKYPEIKEISDWIEAIGKLHIELDKDSGDLECLDKFDDFIAIKDFGDKNE